MDLLVVVLRLVHIVCGVLWAGFAVFTGLLLMPALQDVGPDGGKVMAALQRRRLMIIMPLLALGTLIPGIWLYARDSAGFQPSFMTSSVGLTFGLGGLSAIAAFVVGMTVVRPATMRAATLAQDLAGTKTPQERDQRTAEMQRQRVRAEAAGKAVGLLLLLAAAAMAVARFV